MLLHEAIRVAYTGRTTQERVAEALGVNQSTISKWARGETTPTFDELAALEDACERPRGFVLRLAGLVQDPIDVPTAIENDPMLNDIGRRIALSGYRSGLEISTEGK